MIASHARLGGSPLANLVVGALALCLAIVLAADPARGDPSLNCGAYATKAVEQQKWNQYLGCGFAAPGWSADFNAHFGWCNLANVRMADLTREDNGREAALNGCRQRHRSGQASQGSAIMAPAAPAAQSDAARDILCGHYALVAREQNQENRGFNCGLGGGGWSDDVNGHRAWCLQAGWSAAEAQRHARNDQLNACKARAGRCTRSTDCGSYLCDTASGLCYTSCRDTQNYCAPGKFCHQQSSVCGDP